FKAEKDLNDAIDKNLNASEDSQAKTSLLSNSPGES
ncbi:hypothetical protein Tco_0388565, partial [Tanacetum coccineum]